MTAAYVAVYLAAIVAANLSVATFGPAIAPVNAFLLIGLDLTLRDKLHDRWNNDQLALRMGALILAGGAISYVLNRDAGQIAVASTIAFAVAASLDAIVYARMRAARSVRIPEYPYWRPRWSRLERINGSNLAGAAADSLLFPTIAFGAFFPAVILGQFLAKVAGGFVWSLVLAVPLRRRPA